MGFHPIPPCSRTQRRSVVMADFAILFLYPTSLMGFIRRAKALLLGSKASKCFLLTPSRPLADYNLLDALDSRNQSCDTQQFVVRVDTELDSAVYNPV